MKPIQSIIKLWQNIFPPINLPQDNFVPYNKYIDYDAGLGEGPKTPEEAEAARIKREESAEIYKINNYIEELISDSLPDNNHISKLKDFFNDDKSKSIVSETNLAKIPALYARASSGDYVNVSQVNDLLDILEKPENFKYFYTALHEQVFSSLNIDDSMDFIGVNPKRSNYIGSFANLDNPQSILFQASQKLYTIDTKKNKFIYNGMDGLTDIEKRVLNFHFEQIKYAVASAEKSHPYLRVHTSLLYSSHPPAIGLLTDFSMLAFFEENPEYKGNKYIFNSTLSKTKFSNTNFSFLAKDLSFPEKGHFQSLVKRKLDNFSAVEISDETHNNFINKFNVLIGTPLEKVILNSKIDNDSKNLIIEKYKKLEEWGTSISDPEIKNFITKSQESLLNVVSLSEQISQISDDKTSGLKMIQDVIGAIDSSTLKFQEQSLSFISKPKTMRM